MALAIIEVAQEAFVERSDGIREGQGSCGVLCCSGEVLAVLLDAFFVEL